MVRKSKDINGIYVAYLVIGNELIKKIFEQFRRLKMLSIIVIYAVISFVSLLFMLFLMLTAPKGWEDESGFHNGSKIPGSK